MRVVLTGGSGFLGGRVARVLTERGHDVMAIVRPGSRRSHLDELGVAVVEGHLHDNEFLLATMDRCDGLAHIAGAAGRFYPDPGHYNAVNVDLTRSVFEAARAAGITRAVMCGTVVIDQGLESPYANSKREAVALANSIGGSAMVVTTVHPSGMVGPEDRVPTPLGRGLLQFAEGRVPFVMSGGGGFVHVDDAAEMHVAALEHGESGASYIANASYLEVSELFKRLSEPLGVRPPGMTLPAWLMRLLAAVVEPLSRLVGATPPLTRFTVSYLQQDPKSVPDGSGDRAALGLPPYRSIEDGCLESIRWQRESGI